MNWTESVAGPPIYNIRELFQITTGIYALSFLINLENFLRLKYMGKTESATGTPIYNILELFQITTRICSIYALRFLINIEKMLRLKYMGCKVLHTMKSLLQGLHVFIKSMELPSTMPYILVRNQGTKFPSLFWDPSIPFQTHKLKKPKIMKTQIIIWTKPTAGPQIYNIQ